MAFSKRKMTLPNGEVREGSVIPFEPERENFSTYLLEDGTTLRIKVVLTEAIRIDGEYQPNGDPVYAVQAAQVLAVTPPEHLRKGG